ncbi:hypothetical protein GF359_09965, partial [candidate division WOR-3 bacterium]|nr:hypothetical protein [candidate division WOR-3 bacterium]MBD3365526.1 hypothetical protein [candidate division WOR-3 bacterium]
MKLLKVSVLAAVLSCIVVGSEVKLIPPVSTQINETPNLFLADDPLGFERMVITDDEEWLHNRINQ